MGEGRGCAQGGLSHPHPHFKHGKYMMPFTLLSDACGNRNGTPLILEGPIL